MAIAHHLEANAAWGQDYVTNADWARLQSVLDLARREHQQTELTPERRDEIRERVLARVERAESRRRRWQSFVTGASLVLFVGVLFVWSWWSGWGEPTRRS